jgi:hypothetical protein
MKESYREGVANHHGPEPCESVSRTGRQQRGDAITRGPAQSKVPLETIYRRLSLSVRAT